MSNEWEKRDVWTKRGKTYAIEVSHRAMVYADHYFGPDCWAVYAYIYSEHPLFKRLDVNGGIWQDATGDMPLHCGCTYFQAHRKTDGTICSYQIGADYRHLHDEPYTHMATREAAGAVFADAEELFQHLAAALPSGGADGKEGGGHGG